MIGRGATPRTHLDRPSRAVKWVLLHQNAVAYNLGEFLRLQALPARNNNRSPTTLRDKLVKIGTHVVGQPDCPDYSRDHRPCPVDGVRMRCDERESIRPSVVGEPRLEE